MLTNRDGSDIDEGLLGSGIQSCRQCVRCAVTAQGGRQISEPSSRVRPQVLCRWLVTTPESGRGESRRIGRTRLPTRPPWFRAPDIPEILRCTRDLEHSRHARTFESPARRTARSSSSSRKSTGVRRGGFRARPARPFGLGGRPQARASIRCTSTSSGSPPTLRTWSADSSTPTTGRRRARSARRCSRDRCRGRTRSARVRHPGGCSRCMRVSALDRRQVDVVGVRGGTGLIDVVVLHSRNVAAARTFSSTMLGSDRPEGMVSDRVFGAVTVLEGQERGRSCMAIRCWWPGRRSNC